MSWILRTGRATLGGLRYILRGGGPPPVTLGVRIAAFDGPKILLVRHTYLPGWHMPGGGVDRGESAATAAVRELEEETWVKTLDEPRLFGFYFNPMTAKSDHIAFFVCEKLHMPRGLMKPNLEIAELGFFDRTALPDGTTEATRQRLREIDGAARTPRWRP